MATTWSPESEGYVSLIYASLARILRQSAAAFSRTPFGAGQRGWPSTVRRALRVARPAVYRCAHPGESFSCRKTCRAQLATVFPVFHSTPSAHHSGTFPRESGGRVSTRMILQRCAMLSSYGGSGFRLVPGLVAISVDWRLRDRSQPLILYVKLRKRAPNTMSREAESKDK